MEGYDVWVANDGLAAIKIAGDFEPDVVLLDIALPYIDGYKVCREIKAMLPHTKLIAITGLAQEKDKQFAKSTGFDDYLVKPISPDVLNKMLEKHTNDRTTS